MSKTREIACQHYLNEGNCALGKEGTFRKQCQVCKNWKPVKGGHPARLDLRKKKQNDIDKREFKSFI